jgi:hypothetical protein
MAVPLYDYKKSLAARSPRVRLSPEARGKRYMFNGRREAVDPLWLDNHNPVPSRLNTIMKKLQLTSTMVIKASTRRNWGGIVSFFMIIISASENVRIVNRTIDPVSFICGFTSGAFAVSSILQTSGEILFTWSF